MSNGDTLPVPLNVTACTPQTPYFDILVPTVDTVRYGFLMEKLIGVRHSVLFTGTTGVGKVIEIGCTHSLDVPLLSLTQSVTAKGLLGILQDNSNYVPIIINFSAQTSSMRTQEIIEGKLEKKRKTVLG